jgi:hypothetical protein
MKKSILSVFVFILIIVLLSGCVPAPTLPIVSTYLPIDTPIQTKTSRSTSARTLDITGKYLMVFHACDTKVTDCHDYQNHRVYLAQSDDGAQWSMVPGWKAYSGSVPDVIRRGGTIYIYTPGKVVRYHLDSGILEDPINVTVKGAEGFVDPSVFVDDQGRLVLFFLYGRIGGDPAGCMPDQTKCENRIGSATEVEGSDGLNFVVDEGDRATVTISPSGPIRTASDPDIFFDGKQYVLFIAYGPSISLWTSPELRGTYSQSAKLSDGMLTNNSGGVAAGYFDQVTQQYWTFAHISDQNQKTLIRRAVHENLSRQISDSDWVAITSESLGLTATTNIESPGFAVNET